MSRGRDRRFSSSVPAVVVAVTAGVGFSVILMSVSFGVSREIKARVAAGGPAVLSVLNVPLIDAILTDLTVVVTAAVLIQTAVSTYVLGRSTMSSRREEIAVRRQSGVLRRTLVAEFLGRVLTGCLLGGVLGEALGIGSGLALRHYTALPVRFTALTVLGAFPTAVVLAIGATLIPAWQIANTSPALVRRS